VPSRVSPRTFDDDLGVYGLPGRVFPWEVRFEPGDRAFLDREPNGDYRIRVWSEPGLNDGLVVVRRGADVVGHPLQTVASTARFDYWELVAALEPGDEVSLAFRDQEGRPV
jgi:hypothetical protein